MRGGEVQELGPFPRSSGVGHIAADEHEVERPEGVDGRKTGHDLLEALIAARAGSPAFDPETVALTDDMDVGEMGHSPDRSAGWLFVERLEVARLVHRRVGE